MKNNIYKKNPLFAIVTELTQYLFTAAVLALVIFGLGQTERSSIDEGRRAIEDAVRRATVMCYAIEGRYPEDIAYIERFYGVHIDKYRYAVRYVIFADNLFPNITVIEK